MRVKLYRGTYCLYWKDAAGVSRRRSLRTADREEAERRAADHRSVAGRAGSVGLEALGDLIAAYVADLHAQGKTSSAERAAFALQRLGPTFGALRGDQVDRLLCRSYTAKRQKAGASRSTVSKELGVLRAAMNWRTPHSGDVIETPGSNPPRERHLDRSEYERLLAGAGSAHVRLFIALALGTGARMGAILDLTWNRVDFARGTIRLATDDRNRKGRATVPMSRPVREALEGAKKIAETEYVIEWAGKRVSSIKAGFRAAVKRAGLEDVSPHVMRHTAAVWMAEAGVSMGEIAAFLGHADSRITERVYARFSPTFLRRAVSALE